MRAFFATFVLLAVSIVLLNGVQAGDKGEKGKEVVLKGRITCAKCDLAKETKCMTVIVTKEKGKDVVYYLDPESGKKNHSKVCTEAKEGTVTGVVSTKDDKKTITASKVEFAK